MIKIYTHIKYLENTNKESLVRIVNSLMDSKWNLIILGDIESNIDKTTVKL